MKVPIFVDVEGLRVLVVGGGEEASKKTTRFVKAGAYVTVLSLEFSRELLEASKKYGGVKLLQGDARNTGVLEELVKGSDIVVSTLNDDKELDTVIIDLCRRHRKLYILAGDASRTQCGMGIEGSSGGIRFALYTDGRSSLVAMEARDRVARFLNDQRDLHVMLEVLGRLKRGLKEAGVRSEDRIRVHRAIFRDGEFRSAARANNLPLAVKRAEEMVEAMLGVRVSLGASRTHP